MYSERAMNVKKVTCTYLPTTNFAIFEAKCLSFNKYQNESHSIYYRCSFQTFKVFSGDFCLDLSTYVFINRLFTKITRMFKISLKYVKMHQRALLISFNQHFIQKVLLALHKYFDLKAEAIRHKSSMGKLPAKKISAIENNLTR